MFSPGNQLGFDRRIVKGLIDEVRIWNKAQSAVKINTLKDDQLTGSERGLASYYNFQVGEGTIYYDCSGNADNGIVYGYTSSLNEGPTLKTGKAPADCYHFQSDRIFWCPFPAVQI